MPRYASQLVQVIFTFAARPSNARAKGYSLTAASNRAIQPQRC